MTSVPHSGAKSVTPGGSVAGGEYRVPNFSDVEVAFGASASAYLTREQMGDDFYGDRNEFTRHVNGLFFKGGSVLPEGRRWRAGINAKNAGRAVAALLRSFEPKHEIKVGTVGYALSQWTEATAGETRNAEPIHRRDGDEG